ncbi:hypothetical protein L6R53_17140 [Myxococcota bacterium]|nr:hypothetical protein [Myxococcota bacterium]
MASRDGRGDGDAGGPSGPGRRGLGLAQRLRASIDASRDAARQAEEAQRLRSHRARLARAELLRDLAAFGRALGHAQVSATEDQVGIRFEGRSLRFEAVGDADEVRVQGDGLQEPWRVQHNAELDRWALYPPRGAPRLLFDAGLEELVARVFAVRAADPEAAGEESSPPPRRGGGRSL